MGYQIVGITVIIAWVSLISFPAFLIMRKVHVLRVDRAVEEIGFDVAELGNVSEDFLDAVREKIEA
jgi:ammonia channel protein AmtB